MLLNTKVLQSSESWAFRKAGPSSPVTAWRGSGASAMSFPKKWKGRAPGVTVFTLLQLPRCALSDSRICFISLQKVDALALSADHPSMSGGECERVGLFLSVLFGAIHRIRRAELRGLSMAPYC